MIINDLFNNKKTAVAEGSKMARADKLAKAPKPEDQQEYNDIQKYRKDLAQSYNKEPNFGIKDDEEENKWWIDYDLDEGVAEGSEKIIEYRDRMYQYLKSIVPGFPDYVVKDWLYANFARGATQGPGWSFDTIGKDIPNILKDMGLSVNTKWQLVPNMKFTMSMWEPKTLKRLQARAGGSSKSADPDVHIPARDAERHATQALLAKQQGGVRKEPVILLKTSQGYELLEGWHRTIQHFAQYPEGYTGPAWVAVAQGQQGVAEGKADPVGSWVVYDGSKVKRFKSREGAKAYAAKNGGKVASSEFYADKIQKQGMAEGKKPDNYHIVNKDGKPASLASYADRASAEKDRDEKHPGAEVRQVGPRGKVKNVSEVSLGDYRKKAQLSQAMAQTNRFFDRDDPAKVAAADQTIAKRERGLARADARVKPYTPPAAAPADLEKQQRDLTAKYPNIDELVRRAELNRDPDYEMADGQAYYAARDAEQNYQKLRQIQRVIQGLNESLNRSHLP